MSRTVRAALTETRSVALLPSDLDRIEPEAIRAANVGHHLELLAAARRAGARVIGLGELFTGPYFALERREAWRALAEDALDGPTVRELRAAAREHGLVVVAPLYELDATSGRRFNTAVVIDADGTLLGRYRKTHIPEGTNELGSFHETFYYERSDGELANDPAHLVSDHPYLPVFRTAVGAVGVAICYDRHFEGVMRTLARGGAELVFSPAVTFGEHSRRCWDLEFAVDAARHGLVIGGSNRRGVEAPWTIDYFGESHFVAPDGRPALERPRPELCVCDVRLGAADGSGWNLERDRRGEAYSG